MFVFKSPTSDNLLLVLTQLTDTMIQVQMGELFSIFMYGKPVDHILAPTTKYRHVT